MHNSIRMILKLALVILPVLAAGIDSAAAAQQTAQRPASRQAVTAAPQRVAAAQRQRAVRRPAATVRPAATAPVTRRTPSALAGARRTAITTPPRASRPAASAQPPVRVTPPRPPAMPPNLSLSTQRGPGMAPMPDRNIQAPHERDTGETEINPTILSARNGYRGESFRSTERPGTSDDELFAPMPGVLMRMPFVTR